MVPLNHHQEAFVKFDLFLSLCQTEVDGFMPTEKQMFRHFFDQVRLADELGFGTAWVAETHLSCQVQKQNPRHVIPDFQGEIGLNTDVLQIAHKVFAETKRINVGSAIRNIICNGGPLAHAEAVRTFLTLHGLKESEGRKLQLGFAAGRFPFSNAPYGFYPQTILEQSAWEVIKNKYFQEATEIFLRFLRGEKLSRAEISDRTLAAADFRSPQEWEKVFGLVKENPSLVKEIKGDRLILKPHWNFEKVGVIPFEASLENLWLTIGSHDPETQILANQFLPVGVFNLSITPTTTIEETHQRMQKHFHFQGGPWRREYMPRTVLVFIDQSPAKAKAMAEAAWKNYWRAMEGTLDPKKVESAVANTIAGHPEEVIQQLKSKYHPQDRLMLWFDFNNHDNEAVKNQMRLFMERIAPFLS
jgi:alkanesulfonate monooxygenase SsuD/methylene tetrahydromethanopterin reductase-like flavin-dependent oxidoreductase (luciferase family)